MPSSRFRKFNGTSWEQLYDVRRWNGSAWVDLNANRWDGETWVPMIDRTPGTAPYTSAWNTNWVASYNESGTRINTSAGYQGRFSSTNGRQKAMFGLPYANIRAALSGATIDAVKIKLAVSHSYWGSGAIFQIGTHDYESGSSPTSYTSIVSRYLATTSAIAPGVHEFNVSNTFGTQLRSGAAAGLILETPYDDLLYYGAVTGMQITVDYTK